MYTLACICFGANTSSVLRCGLQRNLTAAGFQACFAVFWLVVAILFR